VVYPAQITNIIDALTFDAIVNVDGVESEFRLHVGGATIPDPYNADAIEWVQARLAKAQEITVDGLTPFDNPCIIYADGESIGQSLVDLGLATGNANAKTYLAPRIYANRQRGK
jgi:hypothetical protein